MRIIPKRIVPSFILLLMLILNLHVFPAKAAEPNLVQVLTTLGFINIVETDTQTFPAGTYNITLYAEFADYHYGNELSYYSTGTTTYNLLFSGPDGGQGYISPPISRIFTVTEQFGLSMFTPEQHRYFTEHNLNPDSQNHSKVYINTDDPDMYLMGFENLYNAGDRDYQDFVFSLKQAGPPVNHDVSILNVTVNTPHEYPGRLVNITVTVKNNGEAAETFDVTIYRNTTSIDTAHVNSLDVGQNTTLLIQWNTTGVTPYVNWTISAQAPLPGDINPSDNVLADGQIYVKMLGDVNADGTVDLLDLVEAALAFGSTPAEPNWEPQADLANPYGLIDIYDLVAILIHYGETGK